MKIFKIYSTALIFLFSFSLSGQDFSSDSGNNAEMNSDGIAFSTSCQAIFSVLPDSLTNFPFYYHFKDLSTGNIDAWHWDFGDGSFSNEQNPSHQYDEAGSYKVCLTVANINDTMNCLDQTCQDLSTMDYFSLGGLVYAGDYPLNNPVAEGDTGIASLYRIVDNQIVFVEDHFFHDYGYYWFGYLFPGKYLVKIGLTPGSTHYHDYFTTYYGDKINWTKADLLNISNSSVYEAEVHLIPVQHLSSGTGIIRGYVKFEQGNLFSMPPISQTTVILSDNNQVPLEYTHPNTAGYFEFAGIPYGTYFLGADATGKPSSAVTITLSENSPVVEGINLTIFGSNVSEIPDAYDKGISMVRIYPNPVKETLQVRLYSGTSAPVVFKITDITGKVHLSLTENLESGFNQVLIPVNSLSSGIYLLIIQLHGSYLPVTAKIIK
jgi:hypothetical protein